MLERIGSFFYSHRKISLLVIFLCVILSGVWGLKVFGTLGTEGYSDPSSESYRSQDFISKNLPQSSSDILVLLHNSSLTVHSPEFSQAVRGLVTTLRSNRGVAAVSSYYDTGQNNFISNDGHETYIQILLASGNKEKEYTDIIPLISAPPLDFKLGGTLVANKQINAQSGSDIERAELITFPIVLILLLIIFGTGVAAILPLITGGVTILGGFAFIHLLSVHTDISIFSLNIITGLGLGLAIDYGLLIVTRFREELVEQNMQVEDAVKQTMKTAGRTVLFSGLTVCISMLSLLLFPGYFLRSMGLGAIGAVVMAMLCAITLIPAFLSLVGPKINSLAIRKTTIAKEKGEHGGWYRLSQAVMKFPIPIIIIVVGILVFLGIPFSHASFSEFSIYSIPESFSSRQVYDALSKNFPHKQGAQIYIGIQTIGNPIATDNIAKLYPYVQAIQQMRGVNQVQSIVSILPNGNLKQYEQLYTRIPVQLQPAINAMSGKNATLVSVSLNAEDNSTDAINTVKAIRNLPDPPTMTTLVGGNTAAQLDLFSALETKIPLALLSIIIAVFILIFFMTDSLVIPLKVVILNFLSLSATFGALVFIFQDGHFLNLLGLHQSLQLESTQLVLVFAVAFGLSMDYEVFLLSRIKEYYDKTQDNQLAIAHGLQSTGGVITSAALLLAVVLAGFTTSMLPFVKMLGVGLTIAVLMDATLVRALLVPATMRLLGKLNWWAPSFLHKLRGRIQNH